MNLPKIGTAGVLGLALTLSLAACTTGGPEPVQESKGIKISVSSLNTPTGQTLGKIYAQALRTAGYQVAEPDASANPYRKVLSGDSEVAIGLADRASTEQFSTADQAEHQVRALDPSAGQSDPVLVMSQAEATFHAVDSVQSLATQCASLKFVGVQPQSTALSDALSSYGCQKAEYVTVPAAQITTELRASLNRVLVLDSADAIIGDEGFEIIAGSEEIFAAQKVQPLVGEQLDADGQNAINKVTKKLDQAALIAINRMVTGTDALDPQTAAQRFLVLNE